MTMEAVVEYEYKAEQEDELNLKVGDVITNVQTAEGGWWEGELNEKKGMFPENFVKLLKKRENVPSKKEEKREATQRKSVRELASKFKDGVPMGGMVPKKKEKKRFCKVLFDYKKENEDELELALGEIVEFHKQVEEGWWVGTLNGKQGVFPSNFVEMIEDTPAPAAPVAPAAPEEDVRTPPVEEKPAQGSVDGVGKDGVGKDEDFQVIRGKKVVGVGLGNIFGGGPIKLRPAGGSKKDEPAKESAKEVAKPAKPEEIEPAPEVAKREKPNERAVVRFSYAAEQPDELSLMEGQIVRIIDKELEDDGWWKGELNGKVGVFPDNFVDLVALEEASKPKKPPPPSLTKQHTQLPKLPEKVPIGDTSDGKVKSDPIVPTVKKPPGPPPIGKKPGIQKTSEVLAPLKPELSLAARPVSNKGKENQTEGVNNEESGGFENLETSGQKLTHLTANRAKGPKKRPPSTVLTFNDVVDKEPEMPEEPKVNQAPATVDKTHSALPAKDTIPANSRIETSSIHRLTPSPHVQKESSSQIPTRPPEPNSAPPSTAPSSSVSSGASIQAMKLIEQLQRDLNELKANSVSKSAFNELHAEHDKLKMEFETVRSSHMKKLRELMNEVDDEKKLRLSTQVEIERMKKLLSESHV